MITERLIIRNFTASDAADLYEYLSQKETVKYEPYEVFTKEQAEREAASRADNPCFQAVCLKDSGKVIGNLYAEKQDFATWEIGYVFNMRYWSHGYATEAATALLQELFDNRNAHRVHALCNPENTGSWKLLERLGMRRESHLRKNIWFTTTANGTPIWQDTYEYAILATDFYAKGQRSDHI